MMMRTRNFSRLPGAISCSFRPFSDGFKPPPPEDPIERTAQYLKKDFQRILAKAASYFVPYDLSKEKPEVVPDVNLREEATRRANENFQHHCDVLIIGGGGIGSACAYWLKERARNGLNVVVVEKDPTYKTASTCLSVGGLRQQFSIEENIQLSLYGHEFLRESKKRLGDDIEVNFVPHGYLMLASEEGAEQLKNNSRLQNELGARNEILTRKQLKSKFPWLNSDDVVFGCLGLEKEGWFDPWALLYGLKRRSMQLGAYYHHGEVVGFQLDDRPDVFGQGIEAGTYKGLNKAFVQTPEGLIREIEFSICVLAAGAESGNIAKLATIGSGAGVLQLPLPVVPRKRFVYQFDCQSPMAPGLNTPMTIDQTGTYFRRDGLGGSYIAGRSPEPAQEPSIQTLDVDYDYFDNEIWPRLAHRAPSFEAIKVKSAWAGFYEFNFFDENGIVGPHPYFSNLIFATGFSGHGIQQAPAVGRAVSELVIDSGYETIDLTRFHFDRILVDQPMYEANIV